MFRGLARLARRGVCTSSSYSSILVETRGAVGLITLNRPEALNALSPTIVSEFAAAAKAFDADPAIGAVVVTGSGKAFAAGADIKFMADKSYMDMHKQKIYSAEFGAIADVSKPIIAAVNYKQNGNLFAPVF